MQVGSKWVSLLIVMIIANMVVGIMGFLGYDLCYFAMELLLIYF